MVDALSSSELDIVVGWGPAVGYYARRAGLPIDVALAPDEILAPESFSIAIAVRDDESALRDDLNVTLDREQARIEAVLAEYGVPLLPLRRGTAGQK